MEQTTEFQDLQCNGVSSETEYVSLSSSNVHDESIATTNSSTLDIQGKIDISDDMYIDDLIQTQENKDDIEHVEALINNDSVQPANHGQSDKDIKSTLDYLNTMREVAMANNISLDDFSKILFNSSSVKVESVSPKSSLRRKLLLQKNQRKTKFANQAHEKKKSSVQPQTGNTQNLPANNEP